MKTSTLLFILVNILVMTIPYWTTKPLNDQIAANKIRDREKEYQATRYRNNFGNCSKLVCYKPYGAIGVKVILDSINQLVMDTSLLNYININTHNDSLKITFDDTKYRNWKKKIDNKNGTYNTNQDFEIYDDEETNSSEIEIHIKKLEFINAFNTNLTYDSNKEYPINTPLTAILDSSELDLNYIEYQRNDSTGEEERVNSNFTHPLKIIKKNYSSLEFSYYNQVNLELTLINDYFSVNHDDQYQDYRYLKIKYNPNSNVGLRLSDLDWIKLEKIK